MSLFTDTLVQSLEESGLTLSAEQILKCEQYYQLVTKANEQLNLTRITEQAQAAQQHFADAMRLFAVADLPEGSSVIDIGTGAGFPGVPLLIMRPDVRFSLLDASGKKTDFVRGALESLGLEASVVCGRAEDLAHGQKRGQFDMAVSRAVALLPMLLELCVPLLRTGGLLAVWKGETFEQDVTDATSALRTLGCSLNARQPVGRGALLLIEKQKPTPDMYPRRFSKIKSQPL